MVHGRWRTNPVGVEGDKTTWLCYCEQTNIALKARCAAAFEKSCVVWKTFLTGGRCLLCGARSPQNNTANGIASGTLQTHSITDSPPGTCCLTGKSGLGQAENAYRTFIKKLSNVQVQCHSIPDPIQSPNIS